MSSSKRRSAGWDKPGFTFALDPVWPPGFVSSVAPPPTGRSEQARRAAAAKAREARRARGETGKMFGLDPQTSHKAAARVAEFAGSQYVLIVDVLRKHGDLTVYEISEFCRLSAHECGKRMHELKAMGKAAVVMKDGGDLERRTPSGRLARVWRAT